MTMRPATSDPAVSYPPVGTPEFFEAIVATSANPFVVLDADFILRYASSSVEVLLGYRPEDWIGRSVADMLDPDSLHTAVVGLTEIKSSSLDPQWVGAPVRLRLKAADGSTVHIDAYARDSPRTGIAGTLVELVRAGASQTMSDAVDTILDGTDLDHALELLTSLIEHDITESAAMLGSGWDGTRFTRVAGRDRLLFLTALDPIDREVIGRVMTAGKHVVDVFSDLAPATRSAAESRGCHGCWVAPVPGDDGRSSTAALFVWRVSPGPPGAIYRADINRSVGLAQLALRWMGHQETLAWMASHDALTGLTNRAEFQNRLDDSDGQSRAVLFCDLDNFKPVNEELGHRVGDRVLAAAAKRMEGVCPDGLVGRVGGDEFAVLVGGVASLDEVLTLADRIRTVLINPIQVDEHSVRIGVTIGAAFDREGCTDPDRLMDSADRLLREGKARGKGLVLSTTLEG